MVEGTVSPVNPYLREARQLADPVPAERANALDITGTDISSMTVDPERAGVDCDAQMRVTSNVPLAVTLRGCDRTTSFDGNGAAGLTEYDPADPLERLDGVGRGAPLPPELGEDVPQAPLQDLPPMRFPPNQEEPTPN